ncbi:MAG: TIM barrel protein [Planctomycetes bacterium]|nr:TIM barrel protein [Planctomycetota bacterium]
MSFGEPDLSRRAFLAGCAAAGIAAARAAEAGDAKPGMRFGFTTYQWGKDWDIPALIANCRAAGVFGVELRTSAGYAHGVELEIGADRRAEVRKRFADSPVALVGLATSERFDAIDPAQVKKAIEATKNFLRLSRDVGGTGVRVFPNDFHKEVPREKTIAQIARALDEVGEVAADLGQQVRLEAHGSAGDLPSMRAILARVTSRSVRIKLNSDARDAAGEGFEHNFNLVKDDLGGTVHVHDMKDPKFPNKLQIALLLKMKWTGWMLLEASAKVEDRVRAIREQRELWEKMVAECS